MSRKQRERKPAAFVVMLLCLLLAPAMHLAAQDTTGNPRHPGGGAA